MSEEQKGKKRTQGCKEQQVIYNVITKQAQNQKGQHEHVWY